MIEKNREDYQELFDRGVELLLEAYDHLRSRTPAEDAEVQQMLNEVYTKSIKPLSKFSRESWDIEKPPKVRTR